MKKMHDQLLRNIYEIADSSEQDSAKISLIRQELYKSVALPASEYPSTYLTKFTTIIEITNNGAQRTMDDISRLVNEAFNAVAGKTYKQLRVPEQFYDVMVAALSNLDDAIQNVFLSDSQRISIMTAIIDNTIDYLDNSYGYEAKRKKMDEYRAKHPDVNDLLNQWKPIEKYTPEEKELYVAYREFRKQLWFNAYWRFYAFFRGLVDILHKYEVNHG